MTDLHSHSTASDGIFSPTDLVNFAAQQGVRVLALTDHDTVGGIAEAQAAAEAAKITLIPGIELEIESQTGTFHLLGLGLGPDISQLEDLIRASIDDRFDRNSLIVKKMNRLGIEGSLDDIVRVTGAEVLGRPHFASFLVARGHATDVQNAFDVYLGHGKPLYEARSGIDLDDAVAAIRSCGGLSIVAHPVSLRLSWTGLAKFADECVARGVDGLEAYHPSVSWREAKRLVEIAESRGLVYSGGSDFHRPDDRGRKIGRTCKEGRKVPEDLPLRFLKN